MYNHIIKQDKLYNLDPRIKLALMIIVSLISLTGSVTGNQVIVRLLIMLIPVVLILMIGKYVKGISALVLITCAWYGEAFITVGQSQFATLAIFIPSGIVTRFLPALVMGYYILKTTQVEVLIVGLESLKLPRQITIPISVMFRFIPTIKVESALIRDAMKMRDISLRFALKKPMQYIEYRIVPMLSSVVKIGNELTVAAMTRGLNLTHRRTAIIKLKLSWLDWLFLGIGLLLCIAYYLL